MLEKIPLAQGARLIYPRITVLATTKDEKGIANAAPYSWCCPVSFKPPMIMIGVQGKETRTIKNLRNKGEFALNVVSRNWAQKAVDCGKSFEQDADKLVVVGLKKENCEKIDAPYVKKAKIVLECKVVEILEPKKADHFVVTAEIVSAKKDPSLDDNEIVLHIGGEDFVAVGEKFKLQRNK